MRWYEFIGIMVVFALLFLVIVAIVTPVVWCIACFVEWEWLGISTITGDYVMNSVRGILIVALLFGLFIAYCISSDSM